MRTLVVNADDFGFTRDVNSGIVDAHRNGILTATTLMATGDAFDDAIRLASDNPALDIGVHLQMVQGRSMSEPARDLPATVTQLIAELIQLRWNVYAEFCAQVEFILAAGIRPTHLDTHKHTHLLPPVLDAVARVSQRYQIPWVRRPFDLDVDGRRAGMSTRLAAIGMKMMRWHFDEVLTGHKARSTDHFVGFVWTGIFTAEDLVGLMTKLPEGSTELMCHPGHLGPDLAAARTRLKQSRVDELRALTDPRVRQAIETRGVRLCGYRELADG